MRKLPLLFILILTTFFVGCSSESEESSSYSTKPVTISGFADDKAVTYYASCEFNKTEDYFLELSTHIPNDDGTSNIEILKSNKFKATQDTNILVDGILVKELEEKIKSKTTINYKELQYQADLFESKNGKKGSGIGSVGKLFENSQE